MAKSPPYLKSLNISSLNPDTIASDQARQPLSKRNGTIIDLDTSRHTDKNQNYNLVIVDMKAERNGLYRNPHGLSRHHTVHLIYLISRPCLRITLHPLDQSFTHLRLRISRCRVKSGHIPRLHPYQLSLSHRGRWHQLPHRRHLRI
jgi:hypothetical protein